MSKNWICLVFKHLPTVRFSDICPKSGQKDKKSSFWTVAKAVIQWKSRSRTTVNVWNPNCQHANYAEIQMEGSSEFRQFGFQTFGLLELHLNCLKSKLATSTIIQHLNALGDGGSGLKRIALNVVLCFTIIPFYFNVWNSNSRVFWDF